MRKSLAILLRNGSLNEMGSPSKRGLLQSSTSMLESARDPIALTYCIELFWYGPPYDSS